MTYAQFAAATTAHDLMTTTGETRKRFSKYETHGATPDLTEQFSLL